MSHLFVSGGQSIGASGSVLPMDKCLQIHQFRSSTQSYPILCNPMNCSMPGFPVHHQLLELVQTHAHQVRDAVQPSPPLLSSSPPAFSLSHHQGLFLSQFFESRGQNVGVLASASVLLMNIQDWFPLGLTGLISLKSKGLSRVSSNTTVQKHQFFGAQLSLWSNFHMDTWLLEKPERWLDGPLLAK